jgi:hypothetical protein
MIARQQVHLGAPGRPGAPVSGSSARSHPRSLVAEARRTMSRITFAEGTFWGLTPTAWTAIGTIVVALVAAFALLINAMTMRQVRENVALQAQALDLGLRLWLFSNEQRIELDKWKGGALLVHELRLVRLSRDQQADEDVPRGRCQAIDARLPKWLHEIERVDFRWHKALETLSSGDVAWFEVEFSLSQHAPRHNVRLPASDGKNKETPIVEWV